MSASPSTIWAAFVKCDCGGTEFARFEYPDGAAPPEADAHLRYIHTCLKCGEQLRTYQTSDEWRRLHAPEPNASTPCTQCASEIRVFIRRKEDFESAMAHAGAVWDRGWFCSEVCREAFNLHAPENGWDRALTSVREKPKA